MAKLPVVLIGRTVLTALVADGRYIAAQSIDSQKLVLFDSSVKSGHNGQGSQALTQTGCETEVPSLSHLWR